MESKYLGRRGVKPLSWTNEALLYYAHGKLFVSDGRSEKVLCDLPLNPAKKLASYSNLASRAMRIEPRSAPVVNKLALVAWSGAILLIDLDNGDIETLLRQREGFSNPLYFTCAETDSLVALWGDYGTNPNRASVAIWGLGPDKSVRPLFEFEPGCIRHVHGVIARKTGHGGYYVFTGDMEEKSGIYYATPDFSIVEPLAVGEQRFRAVRGFSTEDGLIYATDSASIENHIYHLIEDGTGSFEQLIDLGVLNGPCIYGVEKGSL